MAILQVGQKGHIMFILSLPGYTKATVTRAQKMLDIMLYLPDKIGHREYDQCVEMGDGEDVAFLVMHTLVHHKVFFETLPQKTQIYLGFDAWENWKRDYIEKSTLQTKIELDI